MAYLDDIRQVFEMIKDSCRESMSQTVIDLWFGQLKVISMEGSQLTIMADSEFKKKVLDSKYREDLERRFTETLGFEVHITFIPPEEPPTPIPLLLRQTYEQQDIHGHEGQEKQAEGAPSRWQPEEQVSEPVYTGLAAAPYDPPKPQELPPGASMTLEEVRRKDPLSLFSDPPFATEGPNSTHKNLPGSKRIGSTLPPFNFEYTFENFIVGSSNKFAHAACLAVADRPAHQYNPLFVYGSSGLGKTHLLYAITNALKRKNEHISIIYIKGEDFTNQMIDCLSRQNMKEFRDKYRSCDVLLIDDIQFIAGKVSTQEEFFHTFNALYEDGKQIILTSDRPPREIKTLEDRLKTRFEWGLIADIQPPDLELRIAIIKNKAAQVHVSIPDDVMTFLAENLRSNIRQIEGAIKKLGAKSFLSGKEITMTIARDCISELLGGAEPVSVTVDKIFSVVYQKYQISREDLVGVKRTKEIAATRHITIYLIRTVTDMSLPNIGRLFNRDHTTVLSSLEAIERKKIKSPIFQVEMEELVKEIRDL